MKSGWTKRCFPSSDKKHRPKVPGTKETYTQFNLQAVRLMLFQKVRLPEMIVLAVASVISLHSSIFKRVYFICVRKVPTGQRRLIASRKGQRRLIIID